MLRKNQIGDKVHKLLLTLRRTPPLLLENPFLLSHASSLFFRRGPYASLQYLYDRSRERYVLPHKDFLSFLHSPEQEAVRTPPAVLTSEPLVSIIIPFKDTPHLLRRCVFSLLQKATYRHVEIILLNNNSSLPQTFSLLEEFRRFPQIRVYERPGPFNYSRLNNFGASVARGDYLLFLNSDTEISNPSSLEALLAYSLREEVGAVGAKLLYPNGSLQHMGIDLSSTGEALLLFKGLSSRAQQSLGVSSLAWSPPAVMGACLMVRKEWYEEVRGMDERLSIYYNDIDLCLRLSALGKRCVFMPDATLIHHESQTISFTPLSSTLLDEEKHFFLAKHLAFFHHRTPSFALDTPFLHHSLVREAIRLTKRLNRKFAHHSLPRLAVYTALYHGKGELLEQKPFPGVDYYCFTDDPSLRSRSWKVVYLPQVPAVRGRKDKYIKFFPEALLGNYAFSLYMDAAFRLEISPHYLVTRYLQDTSLALFSHPTRNCVYDEGQACIDLEKDDPKRIRSQVEAYCAQDYPPHNGLFYGGILLRRHGDPSLLSFMERWFQELGRYSLRDQISFPYLSSLFALPYCVIPGTPFLVAGQYRGFQRY